LAALSPDRLTKTGGRLHRRRADPRTGPTRRLVEEIRRGRRPTARRYAGRTEEAGEPAADHGGAAAESPGLPEQKIGLRLRRVHQPQQHLREPAPASLGTKARSTAATACGLEA